jgi:hypothetical protein
MQEGGCSIIELGIPYTNPQADGATIQQTNQVAIAGGTSDIPTWLQMVADARDVLWALPYQLSSWDITIHSNNSASSLSVNKLPRQVLMDSSLLVYHLRKLSNYPRIVISMDCPMYH